MNPSDRMKSSNLGFRGAKLQFSMSFEDETKCATPFVLSVMWNRIKCYVKLVM